MAEMTIPTRLKIPRELRARRLNVREATRIPGGFIRIILAGEELDGFESTGPNDHCKLFVPDGTGEMQGRHYTPLHMPGGEIAFDIVTHDDGVISSWAEKLPIGEQVKVGGPRSSLEYPVGASSLVLIGDSSAFPPIRRFLEGLPKGLRADVVIHGDGGEYFDDWPGVFFHHVPFDLTGQSMLDRVRVLPMDRGTYVWAGGEATTLVPLRKWLRRESPIDRQAMKIDGYWKQGITDRDHHAPLDPEAGE